MTQPYADFSNVAEDNMELTLYSEELMEEFRGLELYQIGFEHFKPFAQNAIVAVKTYGGHCVYVNNRQMYKAILIPHEY